MKAADLWRTLAPQRDPYIRRAEEVASVTLPYLFPPQDLGPGDRLPTPYQAVGARGVNNLAAKLTLALAPPTQTFFRLLQDEARVAEENIDPEDLADALAAWEREITEEIETRSFRVVLGDALRQLVVSGNYLMFLPADGDFRGFRLPEFVVDRDRSGNIRTVIVRETIDPAKLDLPAAEPEAVVYTAATLLPSGRYKWWREVGEMTFDQRELDAEDLPFIPLRLNAVAGESYGRGLGEEYLGDLVALEVLSRAIVEGSAASARGLWLVNPAGITPISQLNKARNWAFVPGVPSDIQALQVNKAGDFSVALSTIQQLTSRLEFVFLLNSAVQRQAERVTAEEIRFVAQELQETLGAVYALLTQELQLRVVTLVKRQMEAANKLPELPKGVVRLKVVTGIEGLARNQELARMRGWLSDLSRIFGPEQVAQFLRSDATLKLFAQHWGIDAEKLVRSQEELQGEAQNAQGAALLGKLGPEALKQLGPEVLKQLG